MSDPIAEAFKSLHQGNLLAAKDARIKQLEAEVELWKLRSDNWQKLLQLTKSELDRLTNPNA